MSAAAVCNLLTVVVMFCVVDKITSRSTGSVHTPACDVEEFFCSSSFRCIPDFWMCDREPDCQDGEDEVNCEHHAFCDANEFTCTSGEECIPSEWQCDGDPDCSDGSDELTCHERRSDEEQEHPTHPGHGSHGNSHNGHHHFRHLRPRHLS